MSNANPRNLDPNFKPAEPINNITEADAKGDAETQTSEEELAAGGFISHRRTWLDSDGVQQTKDTRMPMSEWAAYSKKYNV